MKWSEYKNMVGITRRTQLKAVLLTGLWLAFTFWFVTLVGLGLT